MREQNTRHKVLGNIEGVVILICFWLVLKLEIAGSHDLTSFKIFFSDFFSQGMFEKIRRKMINIFYVHKKCIDVSCQFSVCL